VFTTNIEEATLQNTDYRRVLYTDAKQQLVLMSVPPLSQVGMEIHPRNTQFVRVESGRGKAVIGLQHDQQKQYPLNDGDIIVIPFGTYHNIINMSPNRPLQLYTIYSPAEHAPHEVQHSQY
jgi:mannose-6-phosphate isomerase-like protein (cupin superfamily)